MEAEEKLLAKMPARCGDPGRRAARRRRTRLLRQAAGRAEDADHHVDGSDAETDVVRGSILRQRLHRQAVPAERIAGASARAASHLREQRGCGVQHRAYTFRPSAKLLQDPAKNRRIRLTEKEAAILKFLYRAGTRAVARQVLLNECGLQAPSPRTRWKTHIYRLRRDRPDPANARLLVTERRLPAGPEGIPADAGERLSDGIPTPMRQPSELPCVPALLRDRERLPVMQGLTCHPRTSDRALRQPTIVARIWLGQGWPWRG